jgi:hypothetical protein
VLGRGGKRLPVKDRVRNSCHTSFSSDYILLYSET